jgi:membrane protein YdbS with pleckstrin-like domain
MSSATMPSGPLPRLLKATYLANGEYLLEETRATKLFYFPGPIVWTLITGLLTLFSAAAYYGWGIQISAYTHALTTLASWTHLSASTFELGTTLFFLFLVVLGLLRLAVRYLRWRRTVYAVTSRRVIIQRGILSRDFDEIPVTQVRGVDVHQTLTQRMLGYGTVRVSSEGGARIGNEDWKGIPQPFKFQKLIESATINATSAQPPQVPWTGAPRS